MAQKKTDIGAAENARPLSPGRPWLLELATRQEVAGDHPRQVYRESTQMIHLCLPGDPAAIDSERSPMTKKADRETGEDQKGH
jgi:hypothetical protein